MKETRFRKRLSDIREMMRTTRIEWLRFTTQKNISWLTAARTHVNTASDTACCHFLISQSDCIFISNNIESERLLEEEIQVQDESLITAIEKWNWFEPSELVKIIEKYSSPSCVIVDSQVEAELMILRSRIDCDDLTDLRQLGSLTSDAIEQAAMAIQRGDSEYVIAGKLAYQCWERELEPIVNLIAVDERTYTRRHPLPTSKVLNQYAMLVICARKNGLIASATRLVHFGRIPDELQRKHLKAAEIDAKVIHTTRPGISYNDLFGRLQQYYQEAGYPEEYRFHHQGGLTGYASREKIVTNSESLEVQTDQVYAWNPSISGVKSEDTIFIGKTENEIVTPSKNFPLLEFEIQGVTWKRPNILQRND